MLPTPQDQLSEELTDSSVTQPDLQSSHILLGCFIREVSGPDQDLDAGVSQFIVRLPRSGKALRVELKRRSAGGAHRFQDWVEIREAPESDNDSWRELGLRELGEVLGTELAARTGESNEEFAGQLLASRDGLADIARARPAELPREVSQPAADYLDSEQALIAGHPRHPSPKWRSGDLREWRRYSPETRSSFPMQWLAVPDELALDYAEGFDQHAKTGELLAELALPTGHRALPVHPWQYRLLLDGEAGPALTAALSSGALRDLGTGGADFFPTASVRTLFQPESDVFLKMSLNVRITNCLRKNAEYELAGAVELTEFLAPSFAQITARFPRFSVLPEPAARSVRLPDSIADDRSRHALLEGVGVIVRNGVQNTLLPGERLHLAGSLAAAEPDPSGTQTRLADLAVLAGSRSTADWARQWWQCYLRHLVPPVLALWAEHGIVLEPHLQNVLVVLGNDQLPAGVVLRDMEGTKLVTGRGRGTDQGLSAAVAKSAFYDESRAWNRVAYCLFVNNLVEVAGALADLVQAIGLPGNGFETQLWHDAYELLSEIAPELGNPAEIKAVLAGVALPAKTNLLLRWSRQADRLAGYAPFPNPFVRNFEQAQS